MKVLLICSAGMSTSMLVNNMLKVAEPGDVVEALPFGELEAKIDDYDVILLGPQIRFKLDEVKKTAAEHGKPADVIDMRVYGMMNGEAAMKQARELLGK
ncbi:PTS sugar transporter subunit IIB [Actinomycetaceae bacterium L2_0104]